MNVLKVTQFRDANVTRETRISHRFRNSARSNEDLVLYELQLYCHWSHPGFVNLTSNRTFCAGMRDGSGPCNGDSGSGLVLFDTTTNHFQLRGVVSRSLLGNEPSCDLSKLIVFVDVAKYLLWIQEIIST